MQVQDTPKEWFESFVDSFKSHFSLSSWTIYIVILIAIMFIIIISIYYKFLRPIVVKKDRFSSLFDRLCKVNDIKSNERRYIFSVAKKCKLDNPAILFVKRSLFEETIRTTSVNQQKVDAIRKKLYEIY